MHSKVSSNSVIPVRVLGFWEWKKYHSKKKTKNQRPKSTFVMLVKQTGYWTEFVQCNHDPNSNNITNTYTFRILKIGKKILVAIWVVGYSFFVFLKFKIYYYFDNGVGRGS